jgi:hypothetical protein
MSEPETKVAELPAPERTAEDEWKDASRPILYRSEAEAVECEHLRMSPLIRTTETLRPLQQGGPVVLPHQLPQPGRMALANMTLWPACPPLGLVCKNPKVVAWAQAMIPFEVRSGTDNVEVTIDVCKLCPFHQKRKDT